MQYKTELHTHTCEVSPCADFTAPELAERYIAAGYTSLVITNHFITSILDSMGKDWDRKMDFFLAPYRHMMEYAKGRLDILLGAEIRFENDPNDYLLFGLTEEFLREHADMQTMKLKEFVAIARKANILVIQAHPFRRGMRIAPPDDLDGYEVFNAHPGHQAHNQLALEWAKMHGKICTSGSDFHHPTSVESGGIITNVPITTNTQLIEILRSGDYTLICRGPAAERDAMCDIPTPKR